MRTRKHLLYVFVLLWATTLPSVAQTKMKVTKHDGTVLSVDIAEINKMEWVVDSSSVIDENDITIPGEAVDLGLSVKWASCNVGARKPEGLGVHIAWGELKPKADYSLPAYRWSNGALGKMTKYCTAPSLGTVDNKTSLELTDDVARANWGGTWRMPVEAEIDELLTTCTWEWTTQNGVNGCRVTGRNGNFIFLPAAGYCGDSNLYGVGTYGGYWSGSLCKESSRDACVLYLFRDYVLWNFSNRYCGQSVRPVCP